MTRGQQRAPYVDRKYGWGKMDHSIIIDEILRVHLSIFIENDKILRTLNFKIRKKSLKYKNDS